MKLICKVNCSEAYSEGEYFEIGTTKIVNSDIGTYREAEPKAQSRFGYKFRLNDVSKPHMIEIVYPDDRNRYMCINNGSSYDFTTGVVCGYRNKVSNNMVTIKDYFFPRWEEDCIVFSSWGDGEPAAVSEFSIYELDELPDAKIDFNGSSRDFGIQYEDPCGVGSAEGAFDHISWAENVMKFMRFSGQNLLIYPICWYHGPTVPTASDQSSLGCSYMSRNRKCYSRLTRHPNDWLNEVLKGFDEKGLSFIGSMTLLRLRNLSLNMNNDIECIKAGADTYNNILFDGSVQSTTNDWTAEYEADVQATIPEYLAEHGQKPLGVNESRTSDYSVPMFNPIHPTVRKAVKEVITELASRYAVHPSFKGIAINMWHATILWYSSLKAGYDDYSIGLFEAETGIKTNILASDPDRFAKRYEFLMNNAKEEFISWRCEKIKEFILEIRDSLVDIRSDLTLTLTVWNETSGIRYHDGVNEDSQYGKRESNYALYRKGGLDFALFKDEQNIEFSVEHNHQRDRSGWGTDGINAPLEKSQMFCDYAFLDSETRSVVNSVNAPTSFIFNCWVEAWGEYEVFHCDKDDPELEKMLTLPDFKAENFLGAHSEYVDDLPPNKKYFFDSQLRITAAFPTEPYFSEWFANELATQDSLSITSGGLYLDKSHAELQRRFASEFRNLPRKKFISVEGTSDPVTVRYLNCDQKTYIYAVNREPYDISVKIETDTEVMSFTLEPFGLKSFVLEGDSSPKVLGVVVPKDVELEYKSECDKILPKLKEKIFEGKAASGTENIVAMIEKSLEHKNYAFIRHALHSYPVLKTLE